MIMNYKWMVILAPVFAVAFLVASPGFCQSDRGCSQYSRIKYTVSHNGSDNSSCASSFSCGSLGYLIQQVNYFNCVSIELYDDQVLTGQTLFFQSPYELSLIGRARGNIVINCKNSSGLFFQSGQYIHLENLHFIGCSLNVSGRFVSSRSRNLSSNFSSITFSGSQGIEVAGCAFTDNRGSALLFIDVDGENVIANSTFKGNESLLIDDELRSGGIVIRSLYSRIGNSSYRIEYCNFTNNVNKDKNDDQCGGAIDLSLQSHAGYTIVTILHSRFLFNKAGKGGAICIIFGLNTRNIYVNSSYFDSNLASGSGGAISITSNPIGSQEPPIETSIFIVSTCFIRNKAYWGGGVTVNRKRNSNNLTLQADLSKWTSNEARVGGFAVGISNNDYTPDDNSPDGIIANFLTCSFVNNTSGSNINGVGALYSNTATITLEDSTLQGSYGSALFLNSRSQAKIVGNVTFLENFGVYGGGIKIDGASQVTFTSGSNVTFCRNKAIGLGGAIYSRKILRDDPVPCLFKLDSHNLTVTFDGNLADYNDQAIFVGNPQKCESFDNIFIFKPNIDNQYLTIPTEVNFSTVPELVDGTLEIMLGEKFHLVPTVLDKYKHNSTTDGYLALLSGDKKYLDTHSLEGPSIIGLNNFTEDVEFCIKGQKIETGHTSPMILEFFFDNVTNYHLENVDVNVNVVPCKIGYHHTDQVCKCVNDSNIVCTTTYEKKPVMCVKQGYWYDQNASKSIACPVENCQHVDGTCSNHSKVCPDGKVGYCQINDPADLCWNRRGGKLCAECTTNNSFTFMAFKCVPYHTCNHTNTGLIMFGVFIYWIVFIVAVLGILTLHLSVGAGFMYGIIFYFSIITLYTNNSVTSPFLRRLVKFCVSMTQLDPQYFGELEVCFVKSWSQQLPHLMFRYVTPIFVIATIWIIIAFCHYCKVPKRISFAENSPIHAICMLILFSFSSLSYTNFAILSGIEINGTLYALAAPEVRYFGSGHFPYAIFALSVEIFIILPVCFLLLLAPCLSIRVNFVRLRLKPILDEFQACYKPNCRWFAGYYFLARELIYLTNAIPHQGLPQSNTLMQSVLITVFMIHAAFQPYRKKWLNILDTILLLDIHLMATYSFGAIDAQEYFFNKFIHISTPYILLLVPACYLFVVLLTLIFKRIQLWIINSHFYKTRHISIKQNESVIPPTKSTVGIEDGSEKSTFNDSFFHDTGEREPLLSDRSSGNDITSSSVRVSALIPFPPISHKARTN